MLNAIALGIWLSMTSAGLQAASGFTGTWRAVDTTMGGQGESVPTPMDVRGPRTAVPSRIREVRVREEPEAVELRRPENPTGTGALPLSGLAVQTVDREGKPVVVRALRDGPALVIRTERRVRLPGGPDVVVETEDRHVLLADGTLQVTTTARAGTVTQTRQLIYQRVQ